MPERFVVIVLRHMQPRALRPRTGGHVDAVMPALVAGTAWGRMLEGRYEVKVDGAWVSVPHTKILPKSAPEGGYHVCAPLNFRGRSGDLYCVILAPEG